MEEKRYLTFNRHLKETFGEKVYKVTIDAGFTCPNRDGTKGRGGCIYCYGDRYYGDRSSPQLIDTDTMKSKMRQGMLALRKKYNTNKFLAYFQSYTNTYAPVQELERLYRAALEEEYIVGMSVGTRPDCVDESILDVLEKIAGTHYLWVEYGLQSIHDQTLIRINRGHTFEDFLDAVTRTKRRKGIKICPHVILGLPGETRAEMIDTAKKLSELRVDGVKIHSMHILKNTPLETMYRNGTFQPMELSEYVETVCDFLEHLSPEIVIHRLVGDAPRNQYAAPDWCLNKSKALRHIDLELERRGACQGRLLERQGTFA